MKKENKQESEKEILLRNLAENGYNVLFGARKHFATFDIVEKVPGHISLIGIIIGIIQIYRNQFELNDLISVILICVSIMGFTISFYNSEKEKYRIRGEELLKIHNKLRNLYYDVKGSSKLDFIDEKQKLEEIMNEFYRDNMTKQILFSDWYAHYKFFVQSQYEWIDEQKEFTWKDKYPVSFRFSIIILLIIIFLVLKVCL